jgi:phosphoserine phosphatase
MLRRLNWNEGNHRRLEAFLAAAPLGGLAVFDWDNTCICGDIGDAVFRHLLFTRGLRLEPEQLAALLPDDLEGQKRLLVCGKKMALTDAKARILDAYIQVYIGRALSHREFSTPLLALMAALEVHSGAGCRRAYAIVAALLEGYTPRALAALTRRAALQQMATPQRLRKVATTDNEFFFSWRDGLRPYPEMRCLMAAMKRSGMEVLISSATQTDVVEAMAGMCRFPHDRLIGMETGLEPNWGEGKVFHVRARMEREPLFVAGDSAGDIPLLSAFAATRLRLVIDRGGGGEMASFVFRNRNAPGLLVQRVDVQKGHFIPF